MSEEPPGWIGRRVTRVEDARLLTGRGHFIDDHPPLGDVHAAAIVRSPHAHARIVGYDVSAALPMEGVVGVITGEDVARFTRPFPVGVPAPVRYHCAATDKARFVGEPVAVVVARTAIWPRTRPTPWASTTSPCPRWWTWSAPSSPTRRSSTRRWARTWRATGGSSTAIRTAPSPRRTS